MVGVTGIGPLVDPAGTGRIGGEQRKDSPRAATIGQGDRVAISEEARRAETVSRLTEQSEAQSEVREEAVARAKANLEQGTYRIREVVVSIAARVGAVVAAG